MPLIAEITTASSRVVRPTCPDCREQRKVAGRFASCRIPAKAAADGTWHCPRCRRTLT